MPQRAAVRPCDRWDAATATDSLDGTDGIIDHYAIEAPAIGVDDALFRRLEERLVRYDIFPPNIMRAEVCSSDGAIHEGTTIVQHVPLGPFALEAAVRVVHQWHATTGAAQESGFSYATLKGHPERGISTFRLRSEHGRVAFTIAVRSRPGTFLTRVSRPVARRFQRRATLAALAYFMRTSR